jgi:two-component system nitrogen regulation response regulator GlnG
LYYRLKVFSIYLPPLRARKQDLPRLVEHFIRLFNRELGRNVTSVPPETMQIIESQDWPGNVRELQGALKYAFVQASGDVLTPDCLPESVQSKPSSRAVSNEREQPVTDLAAHVQRRIQSSEKDLYHRMHEELDRILLDEALREADGNQTLASKLLGISRTTLRAKLSSLSDSSPNDNASSNSVRS